MEGSVPRFDWYQKLEAMLHDVCAGQACISSSSHDIVKSCGFQITFIIPEKTNSPPLTNTKRMANYNFLFTSIIEVFSSLIKSFCSQIDSQFALIC
jgi:hypothetical protein